jgi:hypothetical protein
VRQLLEPCLIWRGESLTRNGYPRTNHTTVARALYIKAFGPQPELEIDHLCRYCFTCKSQRQRDNYAALIGRTPRRDRRTSR